MDREGEWAVSPVGTALWFKDGGNTLCGRNWFILRIGTGARIIAEDVAKGETPVGILLDRLDEYPEECDAPAEVVAEAVRQLRERNPNGTETNW